MRINKSILALVGILSCQLPLDERAVKIAKQECFSIGNGSVTRNLDLPADDQYLTLSEIARVDRVLQDQTDCYIAGVYVDKAKETREYLIAKKDSRFVPVYPAGYEKIYP